MCVCFRFCSFTACSDFACGHGVCGGSSVFFRSLCLCWITRQRQLFAGVLNRTFKKTNGSMEAALSQTAPKITPVKVVL